MNIGDDRSDFDAHFEDMAGSGEVEVGDTNAAPSKDEADDKQPPKRPLSGAAKAAQEAKQAREAAAASADEQGDPEDGGEDDEQGDPEDGEEQPKRKTPSQRIQELTRRNREYERRFERLEAELAASKNPSGQQPEKQDKYAAIGTPPDPNDQAKYPLGHLDEKYVEDAIDYRVKKVAIDQADAALQRQQEQRQTETLEAQQRELLQKVDTLQKKGAELFDDYEERVVETAKRGEWKLQQPTFEAASEVENGAEILSNLADDPDEAERVSKLSPRQQILYVEAENEKISAKRKGRTKPGAGAPPKTNTRGANSSHRINPATDNLDDFEKAWEQDAKK